MSEGCVFIGGEYVSPEDARMSIFDAGFVWGDTVYDVTSTWAGWFFMLDEHLERFARSCAGFRLENPYSADEMRSILAECVARTGTRQLLREDPAHPRRDPEPDPRPAPRRAGVRGLRHAVCLDLGRGEVPQRGCALSQRRRAGLVQGDRRPLQELQPGGLRAGPLRGLRQRLRRRAAGGRRRFAHRGARLQHLPREGRQGLDAGGQRAGGHHAALGGRALRRGRHPLLIPEGRARGSSARRTSSSPAPRPAASCRWCGSATGPSATATPASSPAASSPATGASGRTAGTARGWRTFAPRPRQAGASPRNQGDRHAATPNGVQSSRRTTRLFLLRSAGPCGSRRGAR